MKKCSILFFLSFFCLPLFAQLIDLSKATLLVSNSIKLRQRDTYVRVLQEEIRLRTSLNLPISAGKSPHIALALVGDLAVEGYTMPEIPMNSPARKKEGFAMVQVGEVLWLIGAEERGVLFAIGAFLRHANLTKLKINVDKKETSSENRDKAVA